MAGEEIVGYHPEGVIFTDLKGDINVLPPAKQRKGETETEQGNVHLKDFNIVAYDHAETKEEYNKRQPETAELARQKLAEFRAGDPRSIATGIEVEGTLYDKDGRMIPVHDGEKVTFDQIPPEVIDSQLEVVTGKTEDGRYPSSALEISQILAKTIQTGVDIADLRGGYLAFSSVPEGGSPDQVRITPHEKIESALKKGLTGVYPDAPPEVINIIDTVGIKDKTKTPFNGTHIHTSNPELENGKYDARAAFAIAQLELAQISQVESFMLGNTRDYLGTHVDNTKDVRSIMKRATKGAQDTSLPNNAWDMVEDSMHAFKDGETHEMSRFPATGYLDRVRAIKEFGTTESVAGAANPDLRILMAHVYFKQLMRVLSYKALSETHGDESKVTSYLQNEYEGGKYGYLFDVLKTKNEPNSSFEQDLRFNREGFDAQGNNGKTYREQMQDMRQIVRNLGQEFPAFRTQARIVDYTFGKMIEPPTRGIGLGEYLNPETGMKGGIVTDYKFGENIQENIRAQAEGTKKQVQALHRVTNDSELLDFFGITHEKSRRPLPRHLPRKPRVPAMV